VYASALINAGTLLAVAIVPLTPRYAIPLEAPAIVRSALWLSWLVVVTGAVLGQLRVPHQ